MRLTPMNFRVLLPAVLALCLPAFTHAQAIAGPQGTQDHFKDPSSLKLPPGQKAAIMEFEDLECPACAHAAPIVHTAIEHYKIPYYHRDFLIQSHIWSRDAAITARYLEDKVSPAAADQYRRDVFANQTNIGSKDDLQNFTRRWFTDHKQVGGQPFNIDPAGRFAAEVEADCTQAARIGLNQTPSLFVLAPKGWIHVTEVTQLYTAIDTALAQTPAAKAPSTAGHTNTRKSSTPRK